MTRVIPALLNYQLGHSSTRVYAQVSCVVVYVVCVVIVVVNVTVFMNTFLYRYTPMCV